MAPQTAPSTVRILRPQAGLRSEVEIAASINQMDLAFSTDNVALERTGKDLVFTFDDGGSVAVKGFYSTFTGKNVPDVQTEGTLVSGEVFFAALDSSLMPAAGDSAQAENAGRFQDWAAAAVLEGIDALDGLNPGAVEIGVPAATLLTSALAGLTPRSTAATTVDPVTPAEPTDPANPADPTDPSDPTVPPNPTDPTDPTIPPNPTDPADPVDPSDPTEPTDPSDPTGPTEPTDPTDPTDPTEPTDPTDPTEPSEPTDPPFVPRIVLHNEFPPSFTAGINSSYGYYIKDPETGAPLDGKLYIIWNSVQGSRGEEFVLEGYTPDQIGFFIVPGGATGGNSYAGGRPTGDDYTLCDSAGNDLDRDRNVIFDDPALNPGGTHNFISIDGKYQFWEDQKLGNSDWDMDDIRVRLEYNGWTEQADPVDSPFNQTYERADGSLVIFGGVSSNDRDELTGGEYDDVLIGHLGNDTLYGGNGNDILYGGAGNDLLMGGNGDDILLGGSGNDVLIGGRGNNYLAGEKGADAFVWLNDELDAGRDILADFKLSDGDTLDFRGIDKDDISFDARNSTITITLTDGGTREIVLEGDHGLTEDNWASAFATDADYAVVAEAVRTIEAITCS